MFFLGGEAGVAETAARRLTREIPGLDVAGSRDGFTVWHSSAEAIAGIRAARTDLLVVAMGNPVQEKWLAEHLGETGARMGHISISGPAGSIEAFKDLDIARKVYVHINNSNPVLNENSDERRATEAAGWEVGLDGMEIRL